MIAKAQEQEVNLSTIRFVQGDLTFAFGKERFWIYRSFHDFP